MTLREAISRCDAAKPNQYTVQEKIRWLSGLDGRIHKEVLQGHEPTPPEFSGYGEGDIDRALMAPAPYDELYPLYLQSQVDYYNAEFGRYNNSAAMFNEAFSAYADYINRIQRPVGVSATRVW